MSNDLSFFLFLSKAFLSNFIIIKLSYSWTQFMDISQWFNASDMNVRLWYIKWLIYISRNIIESYAYLAMHI